jgi:hypothetical protein
MYEAEIQKGWYVGSCGGRQSYSGTLLGINGSQDSRKMYEAAIIKSLFTYSGRLLVELEEYFARLP